MRRWLPSLRARSLSGLTWTRPEREFDIGQCTYTPWWVHQPSPVETGLGRLFDATDSGKPTSDLPSRAKILANPILQPLRVCLSTALRNWCSSLFKCECAD